MFKRKLYYCFTSIWDLGFYTLYETLSITLLPEGHRIALNRSLGGTVCELGSMEASGAKNLATWYAWATTPQSTDKREAVCSPN